MWSHGRRPDVRVPPARRSAQRRFAGPGRPGGDRGAAAAEFAMVMPALVFVIVVVLAAAAVGLGQLRAYEAARAGAREAARGEPAAQVERATRQKAGPGATVGVRRDGEYTVVEVTVPLPETIRVVKRTARARAEARTESGGASP